MIWNINEIENIDVVSKRFWEKVNILEDKNKCWEWIAGIDTPGYGGFKINKEKVNSHRVAYLLTNDFIPDTLFVLHSCDNRLCCNPNHLFLGTYLDNIKDMISKGRNAKGDLNGSKTHPESILKGEEKPQSKLKDADIISILKMYFDDKIRPKEIYRFYNIDKSTFYSLLSGEKWKHISSKIYPNEMPKKLYRNQ